MKKYGMMITILVLASLLLASPIKAQNVPISQLRDWPDLSTLETWLGEHERIYLIVDANGLVWPDPAYGDCDDYARRLRDNAADDGYYLSLQLVHNWHPELVGERDMGNLAIVGNRMYFIQPMLGISEDWGLLD